MSEESQNCPKMTQEKYSRQQMMSSLVLTFIPTSHLTPNHHDFLNRTIYRVAGPHHLLTAAHSSIKLQINFLFQIFLVLRCVTIVKRIQQNGSSGYC